MRTRTLHEWPGGADGRWLLLVETRGGPRILVLYDDLAPLHPDDVVLDAGEALADRKLYGVPAFAISGGLPTGASAAGEVGVPAYERVCRSVARALARHDDEGAVAGRPDFALRLASDLARLRA